MSDIKEMRAALWSALWIGRKFGSEEARAFLAHFERTVRAETTGELERIEEAEEDDEGWDLQKVRAKLEHDTCHTRRREIGLPIKGPVA